MKDPYLYPNTDILKNKFSIKDKKKLETIESNYVAYQLASLVNSEPIPTFDFTNLCRLHYKLFQDIYEWAGKPRIINIEKSEQALGGLSVEYSDYQEIVPNAEAVLSDMNNFPWSESNIQKVVKNYSRFMAELWKVHPFREGNTRTIVTYCSQFIESKGYQIDYNLFAENAKYVRQSLAASGAVFSDLGDRRKPEYLEKIVRNSLERGWDQKNQQGKSSVLKKIENNKRIILKSNRSYSKEERRTSNKEDIEK